MNEHITITGEDPLRLDLYSQHLRNLGYNPNCVVSKSDKQEELTEHSDVVMVEFEVAAANDYAFVKALRQRTPSVYVILIAGKNEIEKAHQAIGYRLFNAIVQMRHFFGCINEILQKVARSAATKNYYSNLSLDNIHLKAVQRN